MCSVRRSRRRARQEYLVDPTGCFAPQTKGQGRGGLVVVAIGRVVGIIVLVVVVVLAVLTGTCRPNGRPLLQGRQRRFQPTKVVEAAAAAALGGVGGLTGSNSSSWNPHHHQRRRRLAAAIIAAAACALLCHCGDGRRAIQEGSIHGIWYCCAVWLRGSGMLKVKYVVWIELRCSR